MRTKLKRVTSDDIESAEAFYANFRERCGTMNEANLTTALGNALAAIKLLAPVVESAVRWRTVYDAPSRYELERAIDEYMKGQRETANDQIS